MQIQKNTDTRRMVERELNRVVPRDFPHRPVNGQGCVFYRVVPKNDSLEVSVFAGLLGKGEKSSQVREVVPRDDLEAFWLTNCKVLGEDKEVPAPLKILPETVPSLRVNFADRLMRFAIKLPVKK